MEADRLTSPATGDKVMLQSSTREERRVRSTAVGAAP